MSALELAEAMQSHRLSSREVVNSHLGRIEVVNRAVNAVTVVLADEALEAARMADQARAQRADLPRFHGVPFTVKGNIDLVGTPTTQGARSQLEALPTRDAPVVERLKAHGAIPLGRTNLPTFALRWHTHSELWGSTVNPWNPRLTPGASSGGEAAALATGMSPLGLGNDGLGSLRWPAQCCGVAALKPTLGRIPRAGTIEPVDGPVAVQMTAVDGPMGRRVADLRAAFEVLAVPSWRDPWSVPAPLRGPPPTYPISVAVVTDPGGQGVAEQVRDGIEKAAAALEDAGYSVVEAEPPSVGTAARALLDMLGTPEIRAAWATLARFLPDETQQFLLAFYEVVGESDPVGAMQAFMIRQSLGRAWAEFLGTHPIILAPISTEMPFEAGRDLSVQEVAAIVGDLRMTLAVNALGLPALAIPAGIRDGVPQGVQLIAARFREDLCLDAGDAIEERVGVLAPIDPL